MGHENLLSCLFILLILKYKVSLIGSNVYVNNF